MDRRKCKRVNIDSEIILVQGSRLYPGRMTNISLKGIMVTSRAKLDSDSELGVHLAGEHMISGNIRWMRENSGGYDMGCMVDRG